MCSAVPGNSIYKIHSSWEFPHKTGDDKDRTQYLCNNKNYRDCGGHMLKTIKGHKRLCKVALQSAHFPSSVSAFSQQQVCVLQLDHGPHWVSCLKQGNLSTLLINKAKSDDSVPVQISSSFTHTHTHICVCAHFLRVVQNTLKIFFFP